jgi:phosphoribosylaminoimidazolecarboxamide formyltransferase/IMP cyclohydrolase
MQETDYPLYNSLEAVTEVDCSPAQEEELLFAYKVVKHVKSNAIVLTKDKQTIGIGPGQVNRIWALEQAIEHAHQLIDEPDNNEISITNGAVMASDAFFPFSDCVETAYKAGIAAIIQPGGSVRDQESIDACNRFKIPMIFTKARHFKH